MRLNMVWYRVKGFQSPSDTPTPKNPLECLVVPVLSGSVNHSFLFAL